MITYMMGDEKVACHYFTSSMKGPFHPKDADKKKLFVRIVHCYADFYQHRLENKAFYKEPVYLQIASNINHAVELIEYINSISTGIKCTILLSSPTIDIFDDERSGVFNTLVKVDANHKDIRVKTVSEYMILIYLRMICHSESFYKVFKKGVSVIDNLYAILNDKKENHSYNGNHSFVDYWLIKNDRKIGDETKKDFSITDKFLRFCFDIGNIAELIKTLWKKNMAISEAKFNKDELYEQYKNLAYSTGLRNTALFVQLYNMYTEKKKEIKENVSAPV